MKENIPKLLKFRLEIEDTVHRFRVHVYRGKDEIFDCGWHGGEFKYHDNWYVVMGPYHGLDADKFRLYLLNPMTEPV